MSQLLKLKCPVCKKDFNRYVSQIKGKTVCCSKKCHSVNLKFSMLGKNNPNFNNTWSKKQKKSTV